MKMSSQEKPKNKQQQQSNPLTWIRGSEEKKKREESVQQGIDDSGISLFDTISEKAMEEENDSKIESDLTVLVHWEMTTNIAFLSRPNLTIQETSRFRNEVLGILTY